jgi:hypothetical protein
MSHCKFNQFIIMLLVLLGCSQVPVVQETVAEEAAAQEMADDYSQALSEQGANWYDPDTDDFRQLDVEISQEPVSHRDSNWASEPSQPQNAPPPAKQAAGSSGALGGTIQAIFWVIVVAIIVAVLGVVVWLILSAREEESTTTETRQRRSSDVDRVEALPFKVRRPDSDLLAEARRHYEAGEYQEAIIYLFSYQLVEMDKHNQIRLAKGKTNRQYLREVGRRSPLAGVVGDTMVAFEDVFFGHYPLSQERFEQCWRRLDEFHQHLGHKQ